MRLCKAQRGATAGGELRGWLSHPVTQVVSLRLLGGDTGTNFERGDDTVGNLFELKIINSSFSSLSSYIIRQTIIYRAIRGNSISINSTLPPLITDHVDSSMVDRTQDPPRCVVDSLSLPVPFRACCCVHDVQHSHLSEIARAN